MNPQVELVTAGLDAQPDVTAASYALLSDSERSRANRIVAGRDRRRFIRARAQLRQLLGVRLHVAANAVELAYGPNGKPALGGRFATSDLRFNTSHCDDVVSYAFSSGREVGIDIERIRDMDDADDLAARFFSDGELDAYRGREPSGRPLAFFDCWTRKEALVKAMGASLGRPLAGSDTSGWNVSRFSPAPGFVGTVVVERRSA